MEKRYIKRNSRSLHFAPHSGRSGRDDRSFQLPALLMLSFIVPLPAPAG